MQFAIPLVPPVHLLPCPARIRLRLHPGSDSAPPQPDPVTGAAPDTVRYPLSVTATP